MRQTTAALLVLVAVAAQAATAAGSPPTGATARCRDGTYSLSQTHSGTCSHHGGVAQWLTPGAQPAPVPSAEPLPSLGRTVLLAPRTRANGCIRGDEPDRRCSPGAYSSGLTERVLCTAGFRTSMVRDVPQSEKYAVEVEYGLAPRLYGRAIEIDHIVPLELGGSNAIANLFPEPGSGAASYHVKDVLENRLHAMVCAGQMGLRAADAGIAADWEALYRRVYSVSP